ncbi:MAG TPA: dephospho-CoA kinase [Elusimicrobiales bacterium]|nr:dephospho-CoA kinase [Elusimicrobiales bacterium]
MKEGWMDAKDACRRFRSLKGVTVVGLTGAVASGKSTVLELFRKAGAFCVSTDVLAREVLTSGACYHKISRNFGTGVFLKDGSIDRNKLARAVFSDKSKRRRLERILHPLILDRALSLIKKSHDKIIIVEVPLLFEAGLARCFSLTVCVDAPYRARLKRAAGRGWTAGDFRARTAAQMAADRKAALADVAIDNGGSPGSLKAEVLRLYAALKAGTR